jgi:ribonuclease J
LKGVFDVMQLTLFGGVNEIGGNKILVEHDKTRLFLDFGTSMGYESDFFSEFLDARANTSLKDRIVIGALPKIDGVYQKDLIIPDNFESLSNTEYKRVLTQSSEYFTVDGLQTFEEYYKKNGRSFADGILLSHAHLDHTGAIGFLHSSIPLYCSKESHILVKAIDEVTNFKSLAITSQKKYFDFYTEKSMFPFSPRLNKKNICRPCNSLSDLQVFKIGKITVKHISQDHSVPGASSYVLEDSKGKRILYTGDIRFHGRMKMSVDDYVKKVGGKIDVMLCEGTRIDSDKTLYEKDMITNMTEKIRSVKGLVFVDFSWKDTTRYETILDACKQTGRDFVINGRLAYLLAKLGRYPNDSNVKVFLKRKGSCVYSPGDYSRYKHEYGCSVEWSEGDIDSTHYDNGIVAADIRKHPGRYVLMLSYFDLNQIFDIADKNGQIPDSFMIKAQCAPFCDEMELDEERFIHWLDMFGIAYELDKKPLSDSCTNPDCSKIKKVMKRDHVSGHVSRNEISEMIGKIKPRKVIPIHTQYTYEFVKIVDKIGEGIEVVLPRVGEIYNM